MKEIYLKIIPNSFKFELINKGDIKMKYRNSILKIVNIWLYYCWNLKRFC